MTQRNPEIKSLWVEDLVESSLAESTRRHTSGLPSQGMGDMHLDYQLSGRLERRLPIVVVVRLAQAERAGTEGEERTYTDNISSRGASGQVTPRNEGPALGKVVYCQMLPDNRYVIGVKFQDRQVTWSAVRRYDGLQISFPAKSESS